MRILSRIVTVINLKPNPALLWTPHYYRQFALSLGKESHNIFSKFNLLNTDTPLICTFCMAPSVSVIMGLTVIYILFLSFVDALKESLGLQLVGPYDILSGSFDDVKESDIISYHLHYRYYYDPPEFLTVIRRDDKTGFHVGYYR